MIPIFVYPLGTFRHFKLNHLSEEFLRAWDHYDTDKPIEAMLLGPDGFATYCMMDI